MVDIKEKYKGIFAASQALEAALAKSGMPEIQATVNNLAAIEQISSAIASNDVYQSIANNVGKNAEALFKVLSSAAMTPELAKLQSNLQSNPAIASAEYLTNFIDQWETILKSSSEVTGMAAQNLATIRLDPDYGNITGLPYGSKVVLNGLTKDAAEQLTQTDEIVFDPRARKFFHKETPENKIPSDNITVVTSAIDIFGDISESELIFFEGDLMANPMMALKNEIGKRIEDKIAGFKNLIDFDLPVFYHARAMESAMPYTEQEMLAAPFNVPSQGRYNSIGVSCYYFADSIGGAVSEIQKHSGGQYKKIQIAGIKPKTRVKLLDLSGEPARTNHFAEHIRFAVDNTPGKVVKQYQLPNFVAQCCKIHHIDGIKYRSGKYMCYVTWKADYFDFVDFEFRKINLDQKS